MLKLKHQATALANPQIYSISRSNKDLSASTLVPAIVSVLWQSTIIFVAPYANFALPCLCCEERALAVFLFLQIMIVLCVL